MNLKKNLIDNYKRIRLTHFLVIFLLAFNMFFFTFDGISFIIQAILIIVVWLHNIDESYMRNKLKETQKHLREDADIFDRNVIVSESDLRGVITYVNSKFCEVTGYAKEELIGKPHSILRDPKQSPLFYEKLWETVQSGEVFQAVFKNVRKDKTSVWHDTSIIPMIHNSVIVGYKAIRFDITATVLAEETLKNSIDKQKYLLQTQSSRFEFAINSSRDGFWDYDLENQNFYLSSDWKRRLGFKEDEKITFLKYLSLIPDNDRSIHHNAMQDLLETYPDTPEYVHFRIRYPLITKYGEKLIIEDVGDVFFNGIDGPKRITGFHRDITDQERQARIIESQNRLSAMGEMIGNIAHQWRQPISAINNVLNGVEFDIELEDLKALDTKIFLDTSGKIKDYTKHLSQTIDDFRHISSDEKIKTDFYVKDVLSEAINIVQKEYENNKIRIQIVEENEHNYEFNGFKRELLQIVINILNNARDALVEKAITMPSVFITLVQKKKEVIIKINDNAGGVPESIINKIFDPYFTTKHESIGTGIGLYMSKKMITEYFDGTICIENENDGTSFIITFPR